MTDRFETILCERCGPMLLAEWMRVFPLIPVVAKGQRVGFVAVLRCKACRAVAAVPVRV